MHPCEQTIFALSSGRPPSAIAIVRVSGPQAGPALTALAGKTLDAIKQRDQVVCGVNTGLAGFSAADSQGNWTGLDVDICKAIAAAVLGIWSAGRLFRLNVARKSKVWGLIVAASLVGVVWIGFIGGLFRFSVNY